MSFSYHTRLEKHTDLGHLTGKEYFGENELEELQVSCCDLLSYCINFVTGMFGSGVASYFKLLRWLCVLNLMLTIFIFSFICIPQVSCMWRYCSNTECVVVNSQ